MRFVGSVGCAFILSLAVTNARAQQPTPPEAPLTLAAATTAALTANPASTSARLQLVQAQARVAQAQAALRSQITLSSSVAGSNGALLPSAGPPEHETFGSVVNTVTVPLPLGHKPRLAVQQASEQLAAAQAQLDSARLTLAGQVSAAYYDLLRKQALLQIAKDTADSATRQNTEAQKRFRAGDVPELDVLRTQVPMASAQAGLYQAENAVEVARQTLNGQLGRPLDTPISVADATPPSEPSLTLEAARTKARTSSPEVRAAEANERALTLARRSAGFSREPDYSLQASDTRSSDRTSFWRLDSVQATITMPLSDGGLARAQIKEADAALLAAHAQTETARQTAEVTVSAAYLNVRSSLRQIDAARTAQEIAQTTYDKTVRGYQAGLYPLTDVLTAQSALTQARIAYTQAIYDAATANAALNNALGILPQ